MSLPVTDDAARRQALDVRESFIVQAPAGSGKTELLIQRMLALLGVVERPEEILAITFTRKAAGEMRTRLLEALEAGEGPPPGAEHALRTWKLARAARERDRRLGWDLPDNPARLNVQTIDSFCASLVRRMPWTSRLGGVPEVAENPRDLYREATARLLARAGGRERGSGEVRLLLRHLDNRMDRLQEMLIAMLQRRDQWLRHVVDVEGSGRRLRLEGALCSMIEGFLCDVDATVPAGLRERLAELGRFAAANLPVDRPRPLLSLTRMTSFPAPEAENLDLWCGLADLLLTGSGALRRKVDVRCGFPASRTAECREMKRRMEETLDELPEGAAARWKAVAALPVSTYDEGQWIILEALLDLLPLAVAELWLVFRQENRVDFAEIALKALHSLGCGNAPSELLLRLDAAIAHILVDEFQDTSCLQYELLLKLTEGWFPNDGRSLFLVGDPMQSIYRFREAEVGLFLQTRRLGLGPLKPVPLALESNFRSQEGIVDWVNDSFRRIFPRRENVVTGAVVSVEAAPVHPPLPGEAVTVHPFSRRDEVEEAEKVAELVEAARMESPEGVTAILVRSRTHLPEILGKLRTRGLRFQAQDIDLLETRPAARDVVSLTRALLHPGDRLAWLAVLRAPWCGLLLGDLHALCGEAPWRTVPELLNSPTVLGGLDLEGRRRSSRTADILRRFVKRRGRVGLRSLVEGCWLSLGGPACYDRTGLEDATAVFDLLEKLDRGGDLVSFEALDEALKTLFAPVDEESDKRLQVMTIHRAKGLEFDTVILPGLGRPPASGDRPLLRWLEHPDCGLLLAPVAPLDGTRRDPIYDTIGRLEREKEELETGRLLYVAATRARRRLHLVGHAKENARGEAMPEPGSLLQKLWPAIGHFFVGRESEGAPSRPPIRAARLRRLPEDWSLPGFSPLLLHRGERVETPSELAEREPVESLVDWPGTVARHVGTVVHAWFERIARQGPEKWSQALLEREREAIERRLLGLGVPPGRLPAACDKVIRALKGALGSDRGRWILQRHREAACEVPLSGVIAGRIVHAVVDRTFVDEDGVRWIIDYKTGDETSRDREAFLSEEEERYRPQLSAYATLFRELEPGRPVRTALYFPLPGWWREVGSCPEEKGAFSGRSG